MSRLVFSEKKNNNNNKKLSCAAFVIGALMVNTNMVIKVGIVTQGREICLTSEKGSGSALIEPIFEGILGAATYTDICNSCLHSYR